MGGSWSENLGIRGRFSLGRRSTFHSTVRKQEKHLNSKNDLKSRFRAFHQKCWPFLLFSKDKLINRPIQIENLKNNIFFAKTTKPWGKLGYFFNKKNYYRLDQRYRTCFSQRKSLYVTDSLGLREFCSSFFTFSEKKLFLGKLCKPITWKKMDISKKR